MGEPKRHHFLPQFYLENFCRDGLLWIRDCKKQEQRQQTPKNTAVIGHYYSIEIDGKRDNQVEKMLSVIEGRAKPVIDLLLRGESIDQSQKDDLAYFISFLWNRVPDFQRTVEKTESFFAKTMVQRAFQSEKHATEAIKQYEQDTGNKLNISAREAVEFASKEEFDVEIHRNESIRSMLEQSGMVANYFRQMKWVVAHCPKETSFVTTDNPLVLTPPPNYKPGLFHSAFGILTPGCEKIVPLSQSCCLFILDKGDEIVHREINRARTRDVNKFVAFKVNQYLIARDERLLSNLATIADSGSRSRDGRVIIG